MGVCEISMPPADSLPMLEQPPRKTAAAIEKTKKRAKDCMILTFSCGTWMPVMGGFESPTYRIGVHKN